MPTLEAKNESKEHQNEEKSPHKRKKRKHPHQKQKVAKKVKKEQKMEEKEKKLNQNFFKEDDLHCIVCFEFPTGGHVYQCKNGHLLCQICLQKILHQCKPQCPSCRVRLSREHSSRNRFAETVLASLQVTCSHEGCGAILKFPDQKEHEEKDCEHRPAKCKFHQLGCTWSGKEKGRKLHQKICPIRNETPRKLLKNVIKMEKKKEKERKKVVQMYKAHTQACDFLSGRCKDLVFRDVVLEKDPITEEIVSKAFTIFQKLSMEVVMDYSEGLNKTGIILRIISNIKRKITLRILILAGPELDFQLQPTVVQAILKKKTRKTEVFALPLTPEQRTTLMESETINIRMGFSDITTGRPVHHFTTLNEANERSDSDESESSQTDDEYSIGIIGYDDDSDSASSDYSEVDF